MLKWLCVFALLVPAALFPAVAQQNVGANEIIVTGMRKDVDGYDAHVPVIGLVRTADYAVQPVRISGDSRDALKRHEEIYAMLKNAVDLAAKTPGIELATENNIVVEPLTLGNYHDLSLSNDNRPDSQYTTFFIKVSLKSGVKAEDAEARIAKFIKAVPTVGRAELTAHDDLTLSVVAPDQYRGQIIDLIAADAQRVTAKMGPGYAVEVKGFDRPVDWTRASLTEVMLYIPYNLTVVPKR